METKRGIELIREYLHRRLTESPGIYKSPFDIPVVVHGEKCSNDGKGPCDCQAWLAYISQ